MLEFHEKIKRLGPVAVARVGRIPDRIAPLFAADLKRAARAVIVDAGEDPSPALVSGVVLYALRTMARVAHRERMANWATSLFVRGGR